MSRRHLNFEKIKNKKIDKKYMYHNRHCPKKERIKEIEEKAKKEIKTKKLKG